MELRPKEDNPQEQRHHTDTVCLATHVLNKTKLRLNWLQRQARRGCSGSFSATLPKAFGGAPVLLFRPDLLSLLGTIRLGLSQFGPIRGRRADGSELSIERLRSEEHTSELQSPVHLV